MTGRIVSSMSPGYLQVNPYFNENASKFSKDKKSENIAVELDKKENFNEKAVISELKKNERKVLSHEAAHVAAGGGFVSSPKYSRVLGPDGKSYITGGEVSISVPSSSDPKETIKNMEKVRAAALAPADPSSKDISVAAAAANAQAQAAAELAAYQAESGIIPQPAYIDRISAELPMVKKNRNSVNNEKSDDAVNRRQEESSGKETPIDLSKLKEYKSFNYISGIAPEDNLYHTKTARKIYLMTSSPKGLWTANNGFEKTLSSPELEIAQSLYIAA